ncbi:hypothetical protein RHSIM_Rhsim07G0046800 [Rhododendron simsii]|uniref:Probable glutathione S-transferase n=1 Tax=Rhododendron simsii TaxID=118357 RepID=A0A834LHL6_RHOSS|nr:hypothetical protein RHSIM_Rhsim07G0046800 [Rhododendron simsii]
MADDLKIFRTWSSRFALRIIWALQLKGLEYETIFEDLSQKSPLLLQYNPTYKKVPVLVHNGKPISESLVILEYIEDAWKQNPLLPKDPYERAMARFWAKFIDDKLLKSVNDVLFTKGKEQEEGIPKVMENLKYIEEELEGKKFFGGATIGFTDIALGWTANLLGVFEEVTGIKFIDAHKFPQISEWMHNFCDVPVIKANWPSRDKLLLKSVSDVLFTKGKEQEEGIPKVMENLKYIEEELEGKKFFGGATIGFTDIALGWTANLLGVIEEVTGIKFIDAHKFPQISEWMHNFCDVPVIKANWPPRDKLITKYQAHVAPK